MSPDIAYYNIRNNSVQPDLSDLTIRGGDTHITRDEWLASMDSMNNNAWQCLHIEEEIFEEEEVVSYNYLPMLIAVIVSISLIVVVLA